jgi:hypothetical protein
VEASWLVPATVRTACARRLSDGLASVGQCGILVAEQRICGHTRDPMGAPSVECTLIGNRSHQRPFARGR